ncbi:HTH-type transcriptional regulator LutR [Vibrio thalassae]|uniref:HTH-type transcriptional regulator LutR n=1 Tax=Vibrio thalassae TaxID=1243014 RepID=A0A240EEC0_9VIBR|nr:HTH-type transcriptional regulator LutR [Vibrio thalassae]
MPRVTSPFSQPLNKLSEGTQLRRPLLAMESLKQFIMDQELSAGDALPQEQELMAMFKMSKWTIREALRMLEGQGLITTRTGPKGGTFVREVPDSLAVNLLNNYFYFQDVSISNLYQLRKVIEPELAYTLAGILSTSDLEQLTSIIDNYAEPATTLTEERDHHIESLKFHIVLANFTDNKLLKFVIHFICQTLSEMTVTQELYNPPNAELWQKGISYQQSLVEALKRGDKDRARTIMSEHMDMAHEHMKQQEARLNMRLLPSSNS